MPPPTPPTARREAAGSVIASLESVDLADDVLADVELKILPALVPVAIPVLHP